MIIFYKDDTMQYIKISLKSSIFEARDRKGLCILNMNNVIKTNWK